ncbi:MAG: trehalose-phosphatase [Pseudolabrys sp.]
MTQLASRDRILENFTALDLSSVALLLDVDGTLIDIGPTPQQVHVPADLMDSLARLDELTHGATALVSGRLIADLDRMFAPLKLSAVGAHGAEMRVQGVTIERGIAVLPAAMRRRLSKVAMPGVIAEDKGYSLTLHFRGSPGREHELREFARAVCAEFPDQTVDLLPGKAIIEIRRAQVNKGEGVIALMKHPPFRGRMPLFIGDDVTDEAAFAVLPEIGGLGYSVTRRFDGLAGMFDSPADVRAALARLAQAGGSGGQGAGNGAGNGVGNGVGQGRR